MTSEEYQLAHDEAEQLLRPLLTNVFLETLTQAARTCGHSVDYAELEDFVRFCFEVVGKPVPELTPFLEPPPTGH